MQALKPRPQQQWAVAVTAHLSGSAVSASALLSCLLCCSTAGASRILLLPTAGDNSHVYTLRKVHDELTLRGHHATVRQFGSPLQGMRKKRCV